MKKRKGEICIEHINIHETVSFKMFILEDDSMDEKIELVLVTNQDAIYKTSDNLNVLKPPRNISLQFDNESIFSFVDVLVSRASLYYENDENYSGKYPRIDTGDTYIICRKPFNENTRYKLILDVFRKSDNEQLLSLNISKTRIILLLQMIKETFEKYAKNKNIVTTLVSKSYTFTVVRNDNTISIRNVWLRNTETIIIKYLINSLIFDHRFGKDAQDIENVYRQIMIHKNNIDDSISVSIKKIGKTKDNFHFVLNPKIASALYLLISDENDFEGDVIDEY